MPNNSPGVEETRTILYVDDNLANLRLVERVLALRPGTRMLTTMRGVAAVDLAREHLPQLILLDAHLPDIQGDEVLRRIRSDRRTSSIPVVAVSADATPAMRERFLASGAMEYLLKPLDVNRLLEIVDSVSATPPSPLPVQESRSDGEEDELLNERALALLRRLHDEEARGQASDLIGDFIHESARCMTELRDAAAIGDAAAVVRLAHALNGLTGSYGSRLVPEKCRRLEVLAASGTLTESEDLLDAIGIELERVHAAMRRHFTAG